MIDQLTVCLPNEPGRLASFCRLLGEKGVQIRALMVAETTDFGTIRVICDRPRATAELLRGLGYSALTTPVVAVEVEDVPGALGHVLDRLAACDLNVEYAYSTTASGRLIDLIKISGEPLQIKLRDCALTLLEPAQVYEPDEA